MIRAAPALPALLAGRRRARSAPGCLRSTDPGSPHSGRARSIMRSNHGTSASHHLTPASPPRS